MRNSVHGVGVHFSYHIFSWGSCERTARVSPRAFEGRWSRLPSGTMLSRNLSSRRVYYRSSLVPQALVLLVRGEARWRLQEHGEAWLEAGGEGPCGHPPGQQCQQAHGSGAGCVTGLDKQHSWSHAPVLARLKPFRKTEGSRHSSSNSVRDGICAFEFCQAL